MFAHLPHRGTQLRTGARQAAARLRRLTAALAAVICGLLASAVIVPAASASVLVPGPGGAYGPIRPAPVPATTIRVVTVGGMAGWQITLIALAAALAAATAAVFMNRARATRRASSATTA
jgi:hypothetical protein